MKKQKNSELAHLCVTLDGADKRLIKDARIRTSIVEKIAHYKAKNGVRLIRKKVERARRAKWIKRVRARNMDPEFGRTLYNTFLHEALRIETLIMQSRRAR